MQDFDYYDQSNVINRIKKLSEDTTEEISKEKIDDKKLFKLRYAQMIQGLYLQNPYMNR